MTVAAVSAIALMLGVLIYWFINADSERLTIEETRSSIREAKATFSSTVLQARVAGRASPDDLPDPALIKQVYAEFDA